MTQMANPPGQDRAFSFITSGVYRSEQRIPSSDLTQAVAKSLALCFGEPVSLASYVTPKFRTPLAYDLRDVWLKMSEEQRLQICDVQPSLFNAIVLFLKAVPNQE